MAPRRNGAALRRKAAQAPAGGSLSVGEGRLLALAHAKPTDIDIEEVVGAEAPDAVGDDIALRRGVDDRAVDDEIDLVALHAHFERVDRFAVSAGLLHHFVHDGAVAPGPGEAG